VLQLEETEFPNKDFINELTIIFSEFVKISQSFKGSEQDTRTFQLACAEQYLSNILVSLIQFLNDSDHHEMMLSGLFLLKDICQTSFLNQSCLLREKTFKYFSEIISESNIKTAIIMQEIFNEDN
jgi:hypothetical protein